MKKKTQGALFNGIAGFPLAGLWAGIETTWTVEIDEFCNKVSKKHFPNAIQYTDIYECHNLPYVDIISGGFPCQPFSVAGQRNGAEDHRFIWPETRRIYKESRPSILVLENVTGLFTILEPDSVSEVEKQEIQLFCEDKAYQTTKTIERIQRRVLGRIIEEIRADGYILPELEDGTPVVLCVPACAVNAPHRRDRVWIVAYSDSNDDQGRLDTGRNQGQTGRGSSESNCKVWKADQRQCLWSESGYNGNERITPHTECYCGELQTSRQQPSQQEPGGNGKERATAYSNQLNGNISGFRAGTVSQQQEAGICQPDAHTGCKGLQSTKREVTFGENREKIRGAAPKLHSIPMPDFRFTESPVCGSNDGISSGLVRNRSKQLKAYGNAIVPQVAYQIFKTITEIDLN